MQNTVAGEEAKGTLTKVLILRCILGLWICADSIWENCLFLYPYISVGQESRLVSHQERKVVVIVYDSTLYPPCFVFLMEGQMAYPMSEIRKRLASGAFEWGYCIEEGRPANQLLGSVLAAEIWK